MPPKRNVYRWASREEWEAYVRNECNGITLKSIDKRTKAIKLASYELECIIRKANFYEMLGGGKRKAETAKNGDEDELALQQCAEIMEDQLSKAYESLEAFGEEMNKVRDILIRNGLDYPDSPEEEPPRSKNIEEVRQELFNLAKDVSDTDDMDDDEWQDIDDDDDDDDGDNNRIHIIENPPEGKDDLQYVVYGFHRLFSSFAKLDYTKYMKVDDEQYAQAAKMLIKCMPSKEMWERNPDLAKSYEEYTLSLFEDLESRRENRPDDEDDDDDDEDDDMDVHERRQADRERKVLKLISSLRQLKGDVDEEELLGRLNMQMNDIQYLYATAQLEPLKRNDG